MSTFGGGYKIQGAASGGQVLGGSQCAFVSYLWGTSTFGVPTYFSMYYGPGQTISATLGGSATLVSGVVFTN